MLQRGDPGHAGVGPGFSGACQACQVPESLLPRPRALRTACLLVPLPTIHCPDKTAPSQFTYPVTTCRAERNPPSATDPICRERSWLPSLRRVPLGSSVTVRATHSLATAVGTRCHGCPWWRWSTQGCGEWQGQGRVVTQWAK